MDEAWLPVANYEGLYEVSNLGRVRSLHRTIVCRNGRSMTKPGRLLKPRNPPRKQGGPGYLVVHLSRDGHKRWERVHKLVLSAFVGARQSGYECRHLNGDLNDNRLANLVWGTPSENAADRVRHGTHNHASKMQCKRGHSFTEENTYINPQRGGFRQCRQCIRDARGVTAPTGPRRAQAA